MRRAGGGGAGRARGERGVFEGWSRLFGAVRFFLVVSFFFWCCVSFFFGGGGGWGGGCSFLSFLFLLGVGGCFSFSAI